LLTDRSGKERERLTRGFRKDFGKERRILLYYDAPTNVAGTAFLTRDYPERGRNDDQWLYLPAAAKVRRIATANRGAYFLETDFTFDDLTRDTKLGIDDYTWKTLGTEQVDGRLCYVVEATPVDEATAKLLGYGRVVYRIDPEIWMVRLADYSDTQGNPLKTLRVSDIKRDQGIWTAHQLDVEQKKTGHRTRFLISDVNYQATVRDDIFEQTALSRGVR
jgi:uncharacterized protein